MRFMGNKTNLTDFLYENISPLTEGLKTPRLFDFFAGTASVGKHFRKEGYEVSSSDILYFSYVLQQAYLKVNGEPEFTHFNGYENALSYLNELEGVPGYVWENFTEEGTAGLERPRKFFLPSNGKKIDAIRIEIENLKNSQVITQDEYYVLLASLLETISFYANVSGVYAAFLKTYDQRALKPIKLRPIEFVTGIPARDIYNEDSVNLLDQIDTDVLYLDPPYNARQYAPNYHVLETLARYDNPVAKGVAGVRDYSNLKSDFCNSAKALTLLERICEEASYSHLVMSYNSEGIMSTDSIVNVLRKFGSVNLIEKDYRRFRSNNNGESATKPLVKEQLFVLKKN